jgi:outer membrane protein TolC
VIKFGQRCGIGWVGISLIAFNSTGLSAPLSLKETIRYAITHAPELDSARRQLQIRDAEILNARAKFLPSLDITSTHGVQSTNVMFPATPPLTDITYGTNPWVSQAGITLTENLYDNHQSITQLKISNVQREAASLQLIQMREQLCLSLVQEIYRYSLAKKISELKTQQLSLIEKELASVQNQYRDGLRTRKDFLRLKIQAQRADIDRRNAENTVKRSIFELRRLAGAPPEDPIEFQVVDLPQEPSKIPSAPPDLKKTPDYLVAAKRYETSPLETYLAERLYWPQINLSSQANVQSIGYLGATPDNPSTQPYSASVFISLNFNLWDWGTRRRNVEIAHSTQMVKENEVRAVSLKVNADLESLMVEMNQNLANFELTQALRDNEQSTYLSLQVEFEEGKLPYLDLITSLKDLLDAKVQYFTAQYGLAESLAKYQYYEASLYESNKL